MNIFFPLIGLIISIPARLKGMKFGKNSFIGPGYDWMMVNLNGIILGNKVQIGRNAWIQTNKTKHNQSKIIIGNNTQIGRNITISSLKKIKIGSNCLFAYNVSVFDHDHNVSSPDMNPIKSGLSKPKEVIIGDDCFIGAHSFILKGVNLGKHCVIGANSVVTKSFPRYSVIAGNPAKLIKKISSKYEKK